MGLGETRSTAKTLILSDGTMLNSFGRQAASRGSVLGSSIPALDLGEVIYMSAAGELPSWPQVNFQGDSLQFGSSIGSGKELHRARLRSMVLSRTDEKLSISVILNAQAAMVNRPKT